MEIKIASAKDVAPGKMVGAEKDGKAVLIANVNGNGILVDSDVKVPFTRPNAKKCICWQCPVQADSACIKTNEEKMGEVMGTSFFEPEIVPGLYCSSGVASCKDIDVSLPCICYKCPVFVDCNLVEGQPIDHYCKNGNAK